MAILIKTAAEIEKMRISGAALRQVHDAIAPHVVPGASTMDLERIAVAKIAALGAIAAFKGYHGFPAALCTSINERGRPRHPQRQAHPQGRRHRLHRLRRHRRRLLLRRRRHLRHRQVSPATTKLLDVTQASLEAAIQQCQVGGRLGDISAAVQEMCEAAGLRRRPRVRRPRHRPLHARRPPGPQLRPRGKGPRLKAGMVLAIEPMINAGGPEVKVLPDGWTAVTVDGSYSAHFEHTVAITKDGPQCLPARNLRPNLGYDKRYCARRHAGDQERLSRGRGPSPAFQRRAFVEGRCN